MLEKGGGLGHAYSSEIVLCNIKLYLLRTVIIAPRAHVTSNNRFYQLIKLVVATKTQTLTESR